MNVGSTVPYCGPIATATFPIAAAAGSSAVSPMAWMYRPGYASMVANIRRSLRRPFWMPARARFSMIIGSKPAPSGSGSGSAWVRRGASGSGTCPAKASERCGERLSTVNGPATRTLWRSTYGLS